MWIRRTSCVLVLAGAIALGAVPAALGQTPVQDGEPRCGTAGTGRAGSGPALRVGTYNVLHTQPDLADRSLDVRIRAIADELVDHGVDVVGMQEVVWSDRHGLVAERIAAAAAERDGGSWAWCMYASNPHCTGEPDQEAGGRGGPCSAGIADQARSGDTGWYEGVAILSRFPIVDASSHRLVGRAQEIPLCAVERPGDALCAPTLAFDTRTVVHARVDTPWGGLDYFTSHLANDETSQSELTRQLQVADALQRIDAVVLDDALPDVYVGDFNTLEGSPVWRSVVDAGFVDGFRVAEPEADGFTSHQDIAASSATVSRRIDYVFVREGGCATSPVEGEILGDEPVTFEDASLWPSDHFGVAVTLEHASRCVRPVPPDADRGRPGRVGVAARSALPATGGGAVLAVVPLVLAVLLGRRP